MFLDKSNASQRAISGCMSLTLTDMSLPVTPGHHLPRHHAVTHQAVKWCHSFLTRTSSLMTSGTNPNQLRHHRRVLHNPQLLRGFVRSTDRLLRPGPSVR